VNASTRHRKFGEISQPIDARMFVPLLLATEATGATKFQPPASSTNACAPAAAGQTNTHPSSAATHIVDQRERNRFMSPS
jgi:hypothetical protein